MAHNLDELVEVTLPTPQHFLILKETLTRIGVPNKDRTKLHQTCYILCKRKRYFVTHFKEMFVLDGHPSNISATDLARRNSIINYLVEHGLCALASGEPRLDPALLRKWQTSTGEEIDNNDFTIVYYQDKANWELVPKYKIGDPNNKRSAEKAAKGRKRTKQPVNVR